jgi:hypothetical protein
LTKKILAGVCCLLCSAFAAIAQDQGGAPPQPGTAVEPGKNDQTQREIAQRQLKAQEHQRVLGIFPNFNVTNVPNAVSLTPKQKFELAFATVSDPITFVVAGADAAVEQFDNDFPGYGQGASGYFKRFGASYLDTFDGSMLGNAVLPSLLHQDPRYFRKGTGSFISRLDYAIVTTVVCKGDNGHWQPNVSNIGGNFAAGGISNLYYPAGERGAWLTTQRALTVTAEGALGAIFDEFWPDVSRRLAKKRHERDAASSGTAN